MCTCHAVHTRAKCQLSTIWATEIEVRFWQQVPTLLSHLAISGFCTFLGPGPWIQKLRFLMAIAPFSRNRTALIQNQCAGARAAINHSCELSRHSGLDAPLTCLPGTTLVYSSIKRFQHRIWVLSGHLFSGFCTGVNEIYFCPRLLNWTTEKTIPTLQS